MRHFFFFICMIPLILSAETRTDRQDSMVFTDSLVSDSLAFPASWTGQWIGSLEIRNAKGLAQSLPMELHILPIEGSESYSWWIFYGEDKVAGKERMNYKL